VAVSTEFKRLFLRGVKWDTDEAGTTLFAGLKALARARLKETKAGKVLILSLANGHRVDYALPMNGRDITPRQVTELCEEVLGLFDTARTNLGGSPTDDQIFTEMLALCAPVTEQYADYTFLRMPA
jgi:hypothetical protein